jgi:hypothetical protein
MDGELPSQVANEVAALKSDGIRYILPVCSPGGNVNTGSYSTGESQGAQFTKAINTVVNQSGGKIVMPGNGQLKVYLDVEGDSNMSSNYYAGWSDAVMSSVGPSGAGYPFYAACYCDVPYANFCSVLNSYPCYGVWAIHPESGCATCKSPGPSWGPNHCSNSTPPSLVWQYAEADNHICTGCATYACSNCGFPNIDLDQTTPGENELAWMLYLP